MKHRLRIMRFQDFETPDPRAATMILLGFLVGVAAIELLVGGHFEAANSNAFDDCYRVSESAATLDELVRRVADAKRAGFTTLVLIGGSTAYGASGGPDETISCHLQHRFTEANASSVRVYNLAADGNRPTDDYLVFKAINAHADYIVVSAYYGWFQIPQAGGDGLEYVAHPEYTFLPNVVDADSAGMAAPAHGERKAEYFFDSLARGISVYRNRQLIQQAIFGDSPEEKPRQLLRWLQCAAFGRCALARYTAFTDKPEQTRLTILASPELKLAPLANESLVPLKYWRRMAHESEGRLFFYFSPHNPALHGMESTNYSANVRAAERVVTEAGGGFYAPQARDLGLEPSDYTDTMHTLDNGNRAVAEALHQELTARFKGLN